MKNQIINEIQRKMLPYLNNEQLLHLKAVLEASFQGVIIEMGEEQPKAEEQAFLPPPGRCCCQFPFR